MNARTLIDPKRSRERSERDWPLIALGVAVVATILGVFGIWAAAAPLDAAVVVVGQVVVDAGRQTVQHLEGGIVRRILVRPGSTVARGAPLIELEPVAVDAAVGTLRAQLDAEEARIARLQAERALDVAIPFPHGLTERAKDPGVARIVDSERRLFAARRRALDEQLTLLRAEAGHIGDEVASLEARVRAGGAGLDVARRQLALTEQLRREQFVSDARVLEFEGQLDEKEQRVAEATTLLAQAHQKTRQNALRIEALRQAYVTEAADELRQAERRADELRERLRPTEDALARSTIVAPIGGEVVDLRVHTVGGVIAPREPLLDIVPAGAPLVIKAKARADDITRLHVGAPAAVQLTAYRRRTTPVVDGSVSYVSADTLVEQTALGPAPYFELHIRVERSALERAGDVAIAPGMPVEAFVRSEPRTALAYLTQPLTQAIRRAGREL